MAVRPFLQRNMQVSRAGEIGVGVKEAAEQHELQFKSKNPPAVGLPS